MTRFIDSNIFIYVLTEDTNYCKTAKAILHRVEEGEEVTTSTLVLEEVFVFLEAEKASQKIPEVLDYIRSYPTLRIVPYLPEDMVSAASLLKMVKFKVDWDDTLITATMKRIGLTEIYSNDSHFDIIPGVKRIFQ
jgi:predicted nucleic acid-binding protein